MPNYKNGKIYKLITPHNPELIYYGSTVLPLYKRKAHHKEDYLKKNAKIQSRELFELGADDVIIILVELYPCNNKEELLKQERYYIENNPCINKRIPTRTQKEYYALPHIIEKEKIRKSTPEYKAWQKEYDQKRRNDPKRKEQNRLNSIKNYQKIKLEKALKTTDQHCK